MHRRIKKELEKILEKIHHKFDKKVFSYTQRERIVSENIPFYFYRIETPPITEGNRTILLDAMGIKPKFATQQTSLKTFFFNSAIKVTTPTAGALLGDKLSIIGPTTIGRPLNDSRNGLEYAKHLFDIGILQEDQFNIEQCKNSYNQAIQTQSKIRNKEYTINECFDDLLFTCQVASLPQRGGEQLIKKLKPNKADRAKSELQILQDGLRRFRPFLVQNISFTWDNLRYNAARTALLAKILHNDIEATEATKILKLNPPTTQEEILALAEQMKQIPEEKRWFIMPNEIANFPKILRTWHSFFFLLS